MTHSAPNRNKLDSLVLLRGIAVTMVCFCHFGEPLSGSGMLAGLFNAFHTYGKYGVHIFFVISGFIIPYSLYKGRYDVNNYFRFLYKRLLRLHPPYLAALAGTLILMFFSYRARHMIFPENTLSILRSLAYFHAPADNPVFWTLAVEAQYYIFIGLFYIVLMRYPKTAFIVAIPVFLALSLTPAAQYVALLQYLGFFLIGTVGFLIYTNNGNRAYNLIGLLAIQIFVAVFCETPAAILSFLTIAIILTYKGSVAGYLQFPGKISYSVYLIHFPLGIKLINLLKPRVSPSYYWVLFSVTCVIIFVISYLFYKVFEDYSEKLSKAIKYTPQKQSPGDPLSINHPIPAPAGNTTANV